MKKFKIGEIVKLKHWVIENQPYGVVVGYDRIYHIVKWFDSVQEDGGIHG